MSEPMKPYTTHDAILAANGLIAAYLDWAKDPADDERPARFAQMTSDAVEAHDIGALLMGLTHVASAAVTALVAGTGATEDVVLAVVAANALGGDRP